MPLDGSTFRKSPYFGPLCQACKQPILKSERMVRVDFQNDPSGSKGLSGNYHLICSKPYASLARVINLNAWGR